MRTGLDGNSQGDERRFFLHTVLNRVTKNHQRKLRRSVPRIAERSCATHLSNERLLSRGFYLPPYFCFCLPSVSPLASPLIGAGWTQPTPDELKMTSDPAAPDAPAVYLFRRKSSMTRSILPHHLCPNQDPDREGQGAVQRDRDPLPEGCEWGKYLQRGRAHHRAGWDHRSVHRQAL